ncbi:MAG: hypothetical protein J7K85_08745 [Anaerolineaceae bacterium]|nr:hypothetical protein [Anaerolineaceae bacterium]
MNIPHNKASQGETEQMKKMEGGPAVLQPTHRVIAYTPLIKKQTSAKKDEINNKEDSDELEQQAEKTMAENS